MPDRDTATALAFVLLCAWNDTTPEDVSADFWTTQDARAREKWMRLAIAARRHLATERRQKP